MSARAVILGLAMGLLVAVGTYFNDAIIRQTYFIGNFMPVSVFGVLIIGVMFLGPLGKADSRWRLRSGEWMVALAIGLAACAWPGANFYRSAVTMLTIPSTLEKSRASWRSAGVMSYVPGGSARLAPGQLRGVTLAADSNSNRDGQLDERVEDHVDQNSPVPLADVLARDDASAVEQALWSAMLPQEQQQLQRLAKQSRISSSQLGQVVQAINRAIDNPRWVLTLNDQHAFVGITADWLQTHASLLKQINTMRTAADTMGDTVGDTMASPVGDETSEEIHRLHLAHLQTEADAALARAARWALVDALPMYIAPPPEGDGVLAVDGRADPWVVDPLLSSREEGQWWSMSQLPWPALRSTLWQWGPLVLMFGLASVCMAIIVHPQWFSRELLPYPLARFAADLSQTEPHHRMPTVGLQKSFWIAFALVLALHVINGLHVWFNQLPQISLDFNLTALRELFPMMSVANHSTFIFNVTLYLTAIAFAFFLTPKVSFSVGFATLAWVMLGAACAARGVMLYNSQVGAVQGNLLRFGAYVAVALTILYTGRRYYWGVTLGAMTPSLGRNRPQADIVREVPRSAVWAVRVLIVLYFGLVYWLASTGLAWYWSAIAVLMLLLMWVVMSRIVAETGLFFIESNWLPLGTLVALVGFEAIGPTGFVVLSLMSRLMASGTREALMPFLSTGLAAADRSAGVKSGRMGSWMGMMVVASLVVAGLTTVWWQYNTGVNHVDYWAKQWIPVLTFDGMTREMKNVQAVGNLEQVVWATPLERLQMFSPKSGAWGWVLLGMALAAVAGWGRLRFTWWPIHPVLFLVWGTQSMGRFGWSFLIGWAIKLAVVKLAGNRGYEAVKPVMIGVIAAELMGAFLWMVVGAVYYMITGITPETYMVYPK